MLPRWIYWPSASVARHVFTGILVGFGMSATSMQLILSYQSRKRAKLASHFTARPIELRQDEILNGVAGLIGNTPLIRINSLSDALGVEILGKAEYLNPGGSVKDRVALQIIDDAEREGHLYPHTGSRIFEGTVGSTGISMATVARARGYETTIVMPDDVAEEKVKALQALNADVIRVRPTSIVDSKQYVNLAREYASQFTKVHSEERFETSQETKNSILGTSDPSLNGEAQSKVRGFFADQFENKSNFSAHYNGTGPEIWRQTNGRVTAFVSGAGTGGTIAGVGQFLKQMDETVTIALSDPEGSGLFNKIKYGVLFDAKETEGTKRRHQVDTVVEGIGINRITRNIELGLPVIDDAFRITDAEAVSMSRYIVQHDGLFLGSSSACNLVACVKLAQKMGWKEGQRIVTILCDSGSRHYSKFWNDDYLRKANILIDLSIVEHLLAVPSDPTSLYSSGFGSFEVVH